MRSSPPLVAVFLVCISSLVVSQTSVRDIAGPQGGIIVYGTLRAMLASFQGNNNIVGAQAAALAKPTVDAIHAIGRQVTERIQESDRQMAERQSSFEQRNDVMDRTSQGFSNYILDKSVILDNQNNAHDTRGTTPPRHS